MFLSVQWWTSLKYTGIPIWFAHVHYYGTVGLSSQQNLERQQQGKPETGIKGFLSTQSICLKYFNEPEFQILYSLQHSHW